MPGLVLTRNCSQPKSSRRCERTVLIYRDRLLPRSETFIINQAESLHSFIPFYVGCRRELGIPLPSERTALVNSGGLYGKCKEIIFKLFGVAPSLQQKIVEIRPALVHAHFGPAGVTVMPFAAALNVPLIVTFHGHDATTKDAHAKRSYYGHRMYVKKRKVLFQKAFLFIAVSDFIRGKLLDQGAPPEKVKLHYIGVDLSKFKPNPSITRQNQVLFVGRLEPNKGCEFLLKAVLTIGSQKPAVEVVVIGDGSLRSKLMEFAQRCRLKTSFLGVQDPKAVRAAMSQARVLCAPSVTVESGVSEGLGMVLLEAQAMGLPVVSFSSGGIPEAVAHGETGFLGPERDVSFLAKHILLLLNEQDLWSRFSVNGVKRVRKLFDLEVQTKRLEEIYLEAIAGFGDKERAQAKATC